MVAASFGRGFYVLDDINILREISEESVQEDGKLYTAKDALWYTPRSVVSSQGSSHYAADNPPFGAVFTYHISEEFKSLAQIRKEKERMLQKEGKDIPFIGWDALDEEKRQEKEGRRSRSKELMLIPCRWTMELKQQKPRLPVGRLTITSKKTKIR